MNEDHRRVRAAPLRKEQIPELLRCLSIRDAGACFGRRQCQDVLCEGRNRCSRKKGTPGHRTILLKRHSAQNVLHKTVLHKTVLHKKRRAR